MKLSLFKLSSDIWSEILSFLENKDIKALLKTSKFFWNINIKRYFISVKKFSNIDQDSIFYKKATNIDIFDFDLNNNISIIPPNCKNLFFRKKSCDLKFDYKNIYDKYLSQLNNLTSLSLYKIYGINIFPNNINHLSLKYCQYNCDLPENLERLDLDIAHDNLIRIKLPKKLKRLYIKIHFDSNVSDVFPIRISELPSNLEFLSCDQSSMPDKLPENLKELIYYNDFIDLVELDENIFKHVQKLTLKVKVHEYNADLEDPARFKKIIENINNLEELETDLEWFHNVTLPNSLKKLKLHFSSFNFFDDTYNSFINFNLNNLISISLINHSKDYFSCKIIANSLIELTLDGRFILKKFDTPNLKKITLLENFKGNVNIPKSVKVEDLNEEVIDMIQNLSLE